MKRFYVPSCHISGGRLLIKDSQAHHLRGVLRLKKGDQIIAFDEKGMEYKGSISSLTARLVTVNINSRSDAPGFKSACKVTLLQSVPKLDKMDYVVQKAAELGVDCVLPVFTKRTISRPDKKRMDSKVKRWQRIAIEACKQSARCGVPEIKEALQLKDALKHAEDRELKLFFCVNDSNPSLRRILAKVKKPPKTIAVFIGPEGDFTPDEAGLARKKGFIAASLGERILRTETAGLYVLSVLDYVFSTNPQSLTPNP